ncbi:hypothetical protein D3C73_1018120 [compost metagenome]
MVPLPVQRQPVALIVELIADDKRLRLRSRKLRRKDLRRRAVLPDDRPTVLPAHRKHAGNPSDSTMILEQHRVPIALGSIDNAALRHAVIMIAQIIVQNDPPFIGTQKLARTVA